MLWSSGNQTLILLSAYSGTLVSIGAKSGAGVINGFHFFGFVVGWIFGRGLFTSRFWNNMDQPCPNWKISYSECPFSHQDQILNVEYFNSLLPIGQSVKIVSDICMKWKWVTDRHMSNSIS